MGIFTKISKIEIQLKINIKRVFLITKELLVKTYYIQMTLTGFHNLTV